MLYKDERWRDRGSWAATANEGGGIGDNQTKNVKNLRNVIQGRHLFTGFTVSRFKLKP